MGGTGDILLLALLRGHMGQAVAKEVVVAVVAPGTPGLGAAKAQGGERRFLATLHKIKLMSGNKEEEGRKTTLGALRRGFGSVVARGMAQSMGR